MHRQLNSLSLWHLDLDTSLTGPKPACGYQTMN
jgi:hypothetical protein